MFLGCRTRISSLSGLTTTSRRHASLSDWLLSDRNHSGLEVVADLAFTTSAGGAGASAVVFCFLFLEASSSVVLAAECLPRAAMKRRSGGVLGEIWWGLLFILGSKWGAHFF